MPLHVTQFLPDLFCSSSSTFNKRNGNTRKKYERITCNNVVSRERENGGIKTTKKCVYHDIKILYLYICCENKKEAMFHIIYPLLPFIRFSIERCMVSEQAAVESAAVTHKR